jgi:hypothetical protein
VQGEARQKRQEQYAVKRDARRDMEADRNYEQSQAEFGYKKERAGVADTQWEDNFQFSKDKHVSDVKHQQGTLAVSQGNLALSNRKFDDAVNDRNQLRDQDNARAVFGASLVGDDGQYITDNQAYADRMNSNPQAIQAMLKVAAGRGLIDPDRVGGYTGAQLIATPKGLALRVAGKDASGKPIKAGGGILSEGGTDDPNDPYVMLNIDQLRQMADPKFRSAQQSDALLSKQAADIEAQSAAEEAQVLGATQSAEQQARVQAEASAAKMAELEAQGLELEAQEPKSLAGTLKSKAVSGLRAVNPALAAFVAPEATMSHYAGTDVAGQRGANQSALGTERATLASANQDVQFMAARAEQIPQVYADRRGQALGDLQNKKLMYGENYAEQARAADIARPAEQKKAMEASNKRYDKVVSNVISDNVFKPRKGEPEPKVSAGEFRTMMSNVDPALVHRIGSSRQFEAAVYHVAEHAKRTGITGKLDLMLEASASGADLDAYTEVMNGPQFRELSPTQRHTNAIEIAKAKAASPDKDVATLAGGMVLKP